MRKHYMTLSFRDNVEVTHIQKNSTIEVTFEKSIKGGFATALYDIQGNLISSSGFSESDLDFFKRFVIQNAEVIIMESRGDI